ncbi:MAG: competence protein CoiA family protein [Hyphomonadaceae bacterium]
MLWADIENVRSAPAPGLRGACPVCARTVIARCGTQRVHHWAHIGERACDRWWEPETQWHRTWKLRFPEAWHECILHDPEGEKHIADVRTPDAVVIEFQYSHLRAEERAARERFYRNMIWVVDGTRLKHDLPRFVDGARELRSIGKGVFAHPFPNELFPKSWLGCATPVFFDFGAPADPSAAALVQERLWCVLPQTGHQAIILRLTCEAFISIAREKATALLFLPLRKQAEQMLAAQRARERQENLRALATIMQKQRQRRPQRRWRPTRSRRRTF